MKNQSWRAGLLTLSAIVLTVAPAQSLMAQSKPATHNLVLANAKQTLDSKGRIIVVANVTGDLPGMFTLALTVNQSGIVTGGEWALSVSYIKFGPPEKNGDGDESESLVQLGVIKGSVTAGAAGLLSNGMATALNGIQLKVTGATVQFAATSTGTGIASGSRLDTQSASMGSLTLTF